MLLEKYTNDLYKCIRCGFCFDLSWLGQYRMCPINEIKGFQSYSAKGKLILAIALLEGKVEFNEDLSKHVFMCTDCGACEQNCFFSLELSNIFDALKADVVAHGLTMKEHASMLEKTRKYDNIFGQPHEKRLHWLSGEINKKAEAVYFVGCTTALARTRIAKANYEIMKHSDLDFTILKNEKCCGFPLLSIGQVETAKKLAEYNIQEIEKIGAQRVVFSCPGCYRMFKKEYPKLVGRLPFEAVHTTEIYEELMDNEDLVPKKKITRKVTYHDPCHLGRHIGLYEPPRKILEEIPGLMMTEMTRNREYAYCCGAGGGLPQAFPEISTSIAVNRLKEAEETGAQVLASSCPACSSNFMLARYRSKVKLDIRDVAELIVETLK
ncbi:(Fe-S)-binding protein [Candidatus Bathyarchaeota archaeon]|nr:(Fe-S)-binding protein [Candidatus Bathyarchaeota archaeon]